MHFINTTPFVHPSPTPLYPMILTINEQHDVVYVPFSRRIACLR